MNIALALICLRNEEVGYVTANMVFIAGSIATEDLLQTEKGQLKYVKSGWATYVRALANARSQFCLLIIEIISGVDLPSSLRRAT